MFSSEEHYTIIGLSEDRLRVAHLKVTPSSEEVISVIKRDVQGIPEEELPKTIRSAMNDLNVKKGKAIYMIPSDVVTTKNIEVPSLDPAEINSIIDLQAGRHTPYSREEIIVGYANIGVYQRNYSKILLVIVNRDIIKKKIDIFELAGLKVSYVVFGPEAMGCFYAKALHLPADTTLGIIHVGCYFTDFIVTLQEKIVACRNIPVGLTQLASEGKEAQTKLVSELKKSVESYQSEDIEKIPSQYILTSNDGFVKDLQPVIQQSVGTNVKMAPYVDNLKISQEVRSSLIAIKDESFLDVIAPGTAFQKAQVDLVPEEVKMQRLIEEKAKDVAMAGIFVSIILLILCGIFISKIHFRSTTLKNLETEYQPKHEEVEALEHIAVKTRLVKDYLNNRMVGLDTINELYNIVPDEIYLNSIILDEQGRIVLQGISSSMSQVFSFVTALEASELFKSVKTTSTTAKKERGKDVAAFEIAFKLESAKDDDEAVDEDKVKTTAEEEAKAVKEK